MSSPPHRPSLHPSARSSTPKLPGTHPRVATLSSPPGRPASAQGAIAGSKTSPTAAGNTHDSLIDNTVQLSRAAPGVVRTRLGSVLARGFILKTDYHKALESLDVSLHGAPNFRASKYSALNIFGAAQPRLVGLKAILSILRCRPGSNSSRRCVWFSTREGAQAVFVSPTLCSICAKNLSVCRAATFAFTASMAHEALLAVYISGRPFVLRDAADPRETVELSDRAESLEAIEVRLKNDVLAEGAKCGISALRTRLLTFSQVWGTDSDAQ